MLGQQGLIILTGVLTASIRMMQQARQWLAHIKGHFQGIYDQLAFQAIVHSGRSDH